MGATIVIISWRDICPWLLACGIHIRGERSTAGMSEMQPCCKFLHHPWHSCISYLVARDSTPGCGQPTEDHLSLRPLGGVQPSPDRFISCLHSSPTVFKVGDYWGEKSSTMKALVVHSLVVQDREWAGLLPPKGKGPFSHWLFDPLRIYFFLL